MALVEALVASSLLAVGVLGAARLILHAQASQRDARAQTLAQALASDALDCALAALSPCPTTPSLVRAGMRYTVTLERSVLAPELQSLQVTVEWAPTGNGSPTAAGRLRWHTRASNLADWHGLSSP